MDGRLQWASGIVKKRMSCLITGNCGFVGRHFQEHLESLGWHVFGFDIRGDDPIDAIKFFQVGTMPFDLAIHCAATIPPIDQRKHNEMPVAADLALDSLFFQWALEYRPTKIVFFSSAAAYPIHLQRQQYTLRESDIDLDNLQQPDAMHGLTKLTGEVQAREARRQGLDILVVRPFSGYGTDQSVDYPFPAFIARAKRKDNPFDIWGSGDQVRDWIHIDDIVNAVMAMLAVDCTGPVNLGTGTPTSLADLAQLVTIHYSPQFHTHPERPMGAYYRCADISLMSRFYQPKISLEEGIRRALEA